MKNRPSRWPAAAGLALCATLLAGTPATALATVDGASPESGTVRVTAMTNTPSDTDPVAGEVFELYPLQADADLDDLDTDDLGDATLLEPTRPDGTTGPLEVPVGDYLLRHVKDGNGPSYADMVFELPTETEVDGARVLAYDLSLFPKPAPDVPPVVVEPEPEPEPAPVTPTPQVPTGDLLGGGRDWQLVLGGGLLLALVGWLAARGRRGALGDAP